MKRGILGTLGVWLASAGLSLGQYAPDFRPAQGYVYPGAPSVYSAPTYPTPVYSPPVYPAPAYAAPGYPVPAYPAPAAGYAPRYPGMMRPYPAVPMYPQVLPSGVYPASWSTPPPWRPSMPMPPMPVSSYPYAIPIVLVQQQLHYPTQSAPITPAPMPTTPPFLPNPSTSSPAPSTNAPIPTDPRDRMPIAGDPADEDIPPVVPPSAGQPGVPGRTVLPPSGVVTRPGVTVHEPGVTSGPAAEGCKACGKGKPCGDQACDAKCDAKKKKKVTWIWNKHDKCDACEKAPKCDACEKTPKCDACEKPAKCAKRDKSCLWDLGHCDDNCHFWFTADHLHWWVRNNTVSAPLVTSGNSVLLGQQDLEFEGLNGVRARAGYRLCDRFAVDMGGFWLEEGRDSLSVASDLGGNPALNQMIVNPLTLQPDTLPLATPGVLSGSAILRGRSQLYGGDSNLLYSLYQCNNYAVNLLGGFRYLRLEEDLELLSSANSLLGDGFTDSTRDRSLTQNSFYGGQVGVQTAYHWGCVYAAATAKVAVGITRESVTNSGTSQTTLGGVTTQGPGLLFVGGFAGQRHDNEMAFVPEGLVEFGVQVTPNVALTLGYSALYWSAVARPGEELSGVFTNSANARQNNDTFFWAQGITAGLAIRY